jgi:hypothetical protein
LPPPPPPPAFFLGYTLPPGHPCNIFTLPPPPADKKRTGPRRKFLHFILVITFLLNSSWGTKIATIGVMLMMFLIFFFFLAQLVQYVIFLLKKP